LIKFFFFIFSVIVGLYLIFSVAFFEQFVLFFSPVISLIDSGLRVYAGLALIVLAFIGTR